MKEEQVEQAEIRKQENKIVGWVFELLFLADLLDNVITLVLT